MRLNNIATKYVNFANIGTIKMEQGSLDGGDDGEYSGVSLAEIWRILATKHTVNALINAPALINAHPPCSRELTLQKYIPFKRESEKNSTTLHMQ